MYIHKVFIIIKVKKLKVVHAPCHADVWWSGDIAACILNLRLDGGE
jgi:hypothetical protein